MPDFFHAITVQFDKCLINGLPKKSIPWNHLAFTKLYFYQTFFFGLTLGSVANRLPQVYVEAKCTTISPMLPHRDSTACYYGSFSSHTLAENCHFYPIKVTRNNLGLDSLTFSLILKNNLFDRKSTTRLEISFEYEQF